MSLLTRRGGGPAESREAVVREMLADPSLTTSADELAERLDRSRDDVLAELEACLREMASEHDTTALRVWARWAHYVWGRAYDLEVDEEEVARIKRLSEEHPVVFLPCHRSNLDAYVTTATFHQYGFPPNHVLGGINLAFWPVGPVARRSGVIFIRRSFAGNEVYKLALRRYLAYLVAAKKPLEWYIEGGRSRTGKLLPPKMGLLSYLARGIEESGGGEVHLVPMSISYERLNEVFTMTAEQRGAKKEPEGLRWLAGYVRSQKEKLGRVRVRFGEPVTLSPGGATGDPAERSLQLSKTAFEVCTRINRATPVTPTSLATLALLGADGWAVTLDDAITLVDPLLAYVRRRKLPGTDDAAQVSTRAGMRRVLAELEAADVVEAFTDGADTVYRISPDRELAAAFFRNGVIHWFVNRAIVELALVAAAEATPRLPEGELPDDVLTTGLDAAFALRDLLKFEFFFTEKAEFETELFAELELLSPHWKSDRTVFETLGSSTAVWGGLVADRVLRSFLEAYWVVADRLVDHGANMVDEKDLVDSCLKVGRQYLLQRRIVSAEAVSAELFRNALQLAGNRGLLDPDNTERAEGRQALAAEVQASLRRLEQLNRWQQAHRIRRVGDQRVDATSDRNAVDISTDGDAVDISQHHLPARSEHDPGTPATAG